MRVESLRETQSTEELVKLGFFTDVAKAIVSCKTLKQTLNEVMNQIGSIFCPRNWSLLLRHPRTGELTFTIVQGTAAEELEGKKVEKGQGIAGWIAENRVPLIIEDVSKDSRFDNTFDENSGFKTESIIGVPLISGGKVFGVIELINKLEGVRFNALDLKLLTTVTDFAAIAIEKAYYQAGIRRMANMDSLTKVYNRRYFQFYLTKEIERTKRGDVSLSLLFIDIDDFKKINDNFGHVAGDDVLLRITKVVSDSVRSSDLVFRYGGDEFVALLPNTSSEMAKLLKKRILANLKKTQEEIETGLSVTLSIGVYEAKGEDSRELLRFVDEDMYMQKFYKQEREVMDVAENIENELIEPGRLE
ncbi:MAG: sensor domain-containing diguanylate cyclase [Spirochaetales bacterium]|nr:sensor domain-containing diguanylate cyclase [Spirochaetales bacterium]